MFISYAGKFITFKIVRDSRCSLHRLNILETTYYNIKVKKLFLNLGAYVKNLNYPPNLRKDRLSTPTSILGLFMSYVCFWETVKIRTERSIIYNVDGAV